MALWKVTNNGPSKVKETNFSSENLLEEKLEDWIATDPSILGEPLLIIGRQVQVADVLDKLDLLALDPDGNAVVIEVKRDHITDPNDMQVLRYASYLSKWEFDQFESVAKGYMGKNDPDFNFNECYEEFCGSNTNGATNIPTPNQDQRMILIGGQVKEKLGSVALWLRDHKIDIKVIEVLVFKDSTSNDVMFEPSIIIPTPVSKFINVGKSAADQTKPWKTDGRKWHFENRCGEESRAILEELMKTIDEVPDIEGPNYSQQYYIRYQQNGKNLITLHTNPKQIEIQLPAVTSKIEKQEILERLGLESFDIEGSLSMKEKLALSSSIAFYDDHISIRCKSDFKAHDALREYLFKVAGSEDN